MAIDQINWRSEFESLKPYLEGRGGVAHVRYLGGACAPNAFLQTIKTAYEGHTSDGRRTSLRIDPDFFTTHYLGDVLQALASKLGCALEIVKTTPPVIEEIVLASGNAAEGNMDVNANVHIHTGEHADASGLRDRRVAMLCEAAQEFLGTGRFMIVLNATAPNLLAPFWRDLWEKGLKNSVKNGLFLVKMVDEEKGYSGTHPDEPEPELVVSLPVEFDDRRQSDAIEDLAKILIREVKQQTNLDLPMTAATRSVRAFVYSHTRSISRLHTEWSGVLMRLVRDAH